MLKLTYYPTIIPTITLLHTSLLYYYLTRIAVSCSTSTDQAQLRLQIMDYSPRLINNFAKPVNMKARPDQRSIQTPYKGESFLYCQTENVLLIPQKIPNITETDKKKKKKKKKIIAVEASRLRLS